MHPSFRALSLTFLCTLLVSGCEKYALDRRMEALCKEDGGVVVYEAVRLPASEFGRDGTPLARYWFDRSVVDKSKRLGPDYRYVRRFETIKAGDPMKGEGRLTRYVEEVFRERDGRLLARSVQYGRSGGDLVVLEHFSTAGCPSPAVPFLTAVFLKESP